MPNPRYESLESGSEMRISNIEDHLKVMLTEGKAEVFGRELPLKEPVFFHQGENLAIFTWHGAKIEFSGKCEYYQSKQTPMFFYINVHSALN